MNARNVARYPILIALLFGAVVVGIRVGAVNLDVRAIVAALMGGGDETVRAIVWELRAPRVVLAALCGAALALSGATYQALLRNPLADPFILGVSSGAAVGAVATIGLGLAALGVWVLPLGAFIGSLVTIVVVLRVALVDRSVLDRHTLLLAGVVVGAFCNAGVLLFLTFAELEAFRSAIFWMMGSLSGARWSSIGVLSVALVGGSVSLFGMARALDLLAVGESTAASLGVDVERAKRLCFGIAALLTATAVAFAGVIGFVGLLVPHAVRMIWGSTHRVVLPSSALLGAAFLVLGDAAARSVAAPAEVPIGVITALVGVPLFVVLLRRRRA